jgi:hypothetical protein
MKKQIFLTMICWLVLAAGAALADGYLADPMIIGMSARPLGMGRAFVAVAEDGDTIFVNPAGLGTIAGPKFSSMRTSLLGEINYLVVGGAYPLGPGAIGVGLVNSSSGDITLTGATGSLEGTGEWWDNVAVVSYGLQVNNLSLGAGLKYFNSGGQGSTVISNGGGTGFDLDLGLLYPANDLITIGANLQNILPASMGGKIVRPNGVSDGIPARGKLGTKLALLRDDGIIKTGRRLFGNMDYDCLLSGYQSGAVHLGLEFWPTANLALRAGSDNNDLTAGIGLRSYGFDFDYAYHPFTNISDNTTHFISIGYVGEGDNWTVRVKLDNPLEHGVVYSDHVRAAGKMVESNGRDEKPFRGNVSLKINGKDVALNHNNTFEADIPLTSVGKNVLKVEASDRSGQTLVSEAHIMRLETFADVPDGYWAKMPIEANAAMGTVAGFADGSFKPESGLSRADQVVMLVRAKGIALPPEPAKVVFRDVKPDFWAAKYIEIAAREGLVEGYPDKTFRPNNNVSRVEGIVMTTRFASLPLHSEVASTFNDLPADHWAAKYVEAAKSAGLIKFIQANALQPGQALTRAESMAMVSSTTIGTAMIKDRFSW